MTEKTTYLGMAGHYASMSEFLLRGYNVATPVVDIGDDIYVVDDGQGLLRRVQVKTADGAPMEEAVARLDGAAPVLQFKLSRARLPANVWPEADFPPLTRGPGARRRYAPPPET